MTSVNFGTVNVLPGIAVDTTGTITITCTGVSGQGTRNCVSIDNDANGYATSRRMASGANRLRYDLFTDAARTTLWGSWETGYDSAGAIVEFPVDATQNITVYGRILALQQTVIPGTYTSSFTNQPFDRYRKGVPQACPAGSKTDTGSFTVSATVSATCSVSSNTLNFGSIGFLASNIDATTSLSVQCSNALPYTVALNGGNAGATDPTQRKMSKVAEQITYGLYRDASRTFPWGSSSGSNTVAGTGSGSAQALTVYGRVPAQTTPSPGVYSDSVVITVTY